MTARVRRKPSLVDIKPCRRERCGHGYVAHREAWKTEDPVQVGCMACDECQGYMSEPRPRRRA